MNLHAVAAAEKARIAGQLVADIAAAAAPGGSDPAATIAHFAKMCGASLQGLYDDLARRAGTEYQEATRDARYGQTARELGRIFTLALQIQPAEIEALLTNPRFLYKRTAELVIEIQQSMESGATEGAEG